MLSKEEIEDYKKLIKSKEYEANSTEKALIEYIDQLETNNEFHREWEEFYKYENEKILDKLRDILTNIKKVKRTEIINLEHLEILREIEKNNRKQR